MKEVKNLTLPPPFKNLSYGGHVEYDGFSNDQRPESTHPLKVCLGYNREQETFRQNGNLNNYNKKIFFFSLDISMPGKSFFWSEWLSLQQNPWKGLENKYASIYNKQEIFKILNRVF